MAKVTINGGIYKRAFKDRVSNDFAFFSGTPNSFGEFILVCPHQILFDDRDTRDEQIALLRSKEQKAMAEFEKTVTDIRTQINSLLALENEVQA